MPDIAAANADRPDADKIAALEREIVALRRQLADCAAQRDEALAQQTATAEVLQVISSSVANTAPVFGKILDSCQRLFDSEQLGIFLVDENDRVRVGDRPPPPGSTAH